MCFAGEDRRPAGQPVAAIKSDGRPVPVQDLLFRAKDLFVGANVAGMHRTEIDRSATGDSHDLGRSSGGTLSNPPVRWPGGTPLVLNEVCQKYLGPKIPKVQFAIASLPNKASQTIPFSRRRSLWQR